MDEEKPLFIPLKSEFYEAFANGTKDEEYRLYGRRWNFDVCRVGRAVVLSKGYGKQNRLQGVIVGFRTGIYPCTDAWFACYACIKIEVKR